MLSIHVMFVITLTLDVIDGCGVSLLRKKWHRICFVFMRGRNGCLLVTHVVRKVLHSLIFKLAESTDTLLMTIFGTPAKATRWINVCCLLSIFYLTCVLEKIFEKG